MFRWKAKAQTLEAENASLKAELGKVRSSGTFALAQAIETDTKLALEDPDSDASAAVDEITARRITEERARQVAKVAAQRSRAAIHAEKDRIAAQAEEEAAQIAQAGVLRFREDGRAEEYRTSVRDRAAARLTALGIAREKVAIFQGENGDKVQDTPADDSTRDKAYYRKRAEDLREFTDRSQMLPFSMLQPSDKITLAFTDKGRGREQTTESAGYGARRYRSELEMRKLTCTVIDPETGLVEVDKDSWLDRGHTADKALRGGRQCIITAQNPETDEPEPLLVKAHSVDIQPLKGNALEPSDLALWWVDIGEFKALS